MRDKTCVITGATSGIGKAAAVSLAKLGAATILVGRNSDAGCRLEKSLSRINSDRARFFQADLSSQEEVVALAHGIAQICKCIDVLVNNAGARFDTYAESVDGIEMTLATNHLSHFLLTGLLLERLRRSPQARVISVGSRVHASATPGEWSLPVQRYDRKLAYAKSKLANVMFAYSLAEYCSDHGIVSNAVDPGIVASRFGRNNGMISWLKHLAAHAMKRELRSPRHGAATILYLASSSEAAGISGKCFRDNQQVPSSPASYDETARRELWSLSRQLTGSRVF